jgi:predicted permease
MAFRGDAAFALRRLAARLRRDRLDDDLRDEIAQHIELRRQQLIEEGVDPREAAYEARRIFGNPTVIREETRDMWSFQWIESLLQDTRFGARLLRRSPIFTLTAIASLAIGIGAAAAVFSLADGILFRTLPVRDPQQLVLFRWISGPEIPFHSLNGFSNETETRSSSTSFPLATFEAARERLAPEAIVFGFADLYRASLSMDGRADVVFAQVVSGNYFDALGLTPAAGRLLGPGDDRADAAPAAVVSYEFWQRRFGGAADAIGRLFTLNNVSFTVAGVLPRRFTGTMQVGQPVDVMVPLATYKAVARSDDDPANANYWWVLMMARLRPGVTADHIASTADLVLKQGVTAAMPDFSADKLPRMRVELGHRGQTEIRDQIREPIQIMAGVVLIVLLVACANVANLLLARGRARAREIAVRAAIGAPRLRILRQLLTEGLLLGVLASAAGLVLAQWISSALLPALTPDTESVTIQYALDLRIVAFTSALGIACSVLFALVPALRTADGAVRLAFHESARGAVGTRRRFIAGGALVVTQVALSLLLLSAAALLAWSASRLQNVDPGFDPTNLLTVSVDATLNGYHETRTRSFVGDALAQLRALPGVTYASASNIRLIASSSSSGITRPEGAPPVDPNSNEARELSRTNRTWRLAVDSAFFDTFRIPMLRGRTFSSTVAPDGPGLAVVNEALARQLFGTTDVVGRRFVGSLRAGSKPTEIVGVARDAHYTSLRTSPPPTAYFPYQQAPAGRVTFAIRTAGDPLAMASTVRDAIRRVDSTLPLFHVRTQEDQIRRSTAQERLFANLALLLGAVTLVLSAVGLYGILAYAVTRRTPEIGVRIALGAERRQVRWLILRQSFVLVGLGLLLGIPAAAASAHLLESLLFGLSPYDLRALSVAVVLMVAVGMAAAYFPARRAARIDPLTALRRE